MSDIAITFLRTHPAYPCFPGQTMDVELVAAGGLIAEGFAVPAATSGPPILPAAPTDAYARPETSAYERAMIPDPAPTVPPTDTDLPSVNY